jgi:PAS domain S-box-containing protein
VHDPGPVLGPEILERDEVKKTVLKSLSFFFTQDEGSGRTRLVVSAERSGFLQKNKPILRVMKKPFRNILVQTLMVLLLLPGLCQASDDREIEIGIPGSFPPFAFWDPGLKVYRGFCVDLARMAGKLMKSDMKFQALDESSLIQALLDGQIDIVGCTLVKPVPESDYKLIDTGIKVERHLFVHKTCLTVTCMKDTPGHRLVIEKERFLDSRESLLPGISILEAGSGEEALRVLDAGAADIYISPGTLSTLYLIQKNGFQNIKEVGMPVEISPLYFAVRKDRVDLLSDLSVALGKIVEGESYQLISKKWLGRGVEVNVWIKYIQYILLALAGLAAVLLGFATWNFMLKRKVQKITKELTHSEQRYRELIESSPEMIQIIYGDGSLMLTNDLALKLLEYKETDMVGKKLTDFVVPEQKEEMQGFVTSLFQNGYGEKEFTFRAGDGTQIPVEMIATTISGTSQPNVLASCFSRDIRARKRLEEGLIRSERLAIMGQVSAGLAHEINNPLSIVLGHAQEMLGEPAGGESLRQGLDIIVKNTLRAGRIVNDLLSFTRQGPPLKSRLNLIDLMEDSLLFVHSKLKAKKITVRKEIAPDEVSVYGDESQLMQVLVNLLLNSIQALNEGGLITVRAKVQNSGPKQEALLEVEDNGPGIEPSEIKKIFDPFYTTKEAGFGLGLFISSTIVERHHGSIWAESKEGCGTTMKVVLPVLSSDSGPPGRGE